MANEACTLGLFDRSQVESRRQSIYHVLHLQCIYVQGAAGVRGTHPESMRSYLQPGLHQHPRDGTFDSFACRRSSCSGHDLYGYIYDRTQRSIDMDRIHFVDPSIGITLELHHFGRHDSATVYWTNLVGSFQEQS